MQGALSERFRFHGLMGGKKVRNKAPVSESSSEELSKLKSEYEEVVAKFSKESPTVSTAPGGKASAVATEQKPAASAKGDDESADELEEITVAENWMRFLKGNAELLVLYGLIEVTILRPQPDRLIACMCHSCLNSRSLHLPSCFTCIVPWPRFLSFHISRNRLRTRKLLACL